MCEMDMESSSEMMNAHSQKPVSFNSLFHQLLNLERPCPEDTCDLCDCARIREQHLKLVEEKNQLQERARQLEELKASMLQMPPEVMVNAVVEECMQFLLSKGFDPKYEQAMRAAIAKGTNPAKFRFFFQKMAAAGEVDPIFEPFMIKPPDIGANPGS
ncbi:unnamed protein product [Linum tenue]|uniref:Uncharacterized protein n=1 Tax=Linum tenue TaxID=586396 RepID=A0AAV0KNU5_9ROSI|nr:unnamed protein product [Linum tenue]CAI0422503.1 unnamed protein product [Linum tenue]